MKPERLLILNNQQVGTTEDRVSIMSCSRYRLALWNWGRAERSRWWIDLRIHIVRHTEWCDAKIENSLMIECLNAYYLFLSRQDILHKTDLHSMCKQDRHRLSVCRKKWRVLGKRWGGRQRQIGEELKRIKEDWNSRSEWTPNITYEYM